MALARVNPPISKLPQVGTTVFTRMSALAAESGALNLSQGFPDFAPPAGLLEALADTAQAGYHQYAPMTGLPALREAIADQLQRFRAVSVDAEREITVVPGATEGLFCTITALVKQGDEVILLDPAYDSYEPAVRLAGGRPVHVPLNERFLPDWQRIADAVSPSTRMIVINSPHNPTGSVWSADDMSALEILAEQHNLWVCSDEVYEFLVYDGREHRSVLQYPGLRARSVAHFSFGKTLSVTGWKTGYCVAPPALTDELRRVHQYVAFVAVTPIQQALARFMQAQPDYPASLATQYQARRDLFLHALADSRFTYVPSGGTYFQLLDYSAISDEVDEVLACAWTREHGVAAIPLTPFYESVQQGQHLLRFCFAKSDATLLAAAARLCEI